MYLKTGDLPSVQKSATTIGFEQVSSFTEAEDHTYVDYAVCEASIDFDSDLDPLDFNSVAVLLDFHRFS